MFGWTATRRTSGGYPSWPRCCSSHGTVPGPSTGRFRRRHIQCQSGRLCRNLWISPGEGGGILPGPALFPSYAAWSGARGGCSHPGRVLPRARSRWPSGTYQPPCCTMRSSACKGAKYCSVGRPASGPVPHTCVQAGSSPAANHSYITCPWCGPVIVLPWSSSMYQAVCPQEGKTLDRKRDCARVADAGDAIGPERWGLWHADWCLGCTVTPSKERWRHGEGWQQSKALTATAGGSQCTLRGPGGSVNFGVHPGRQQAEAKRCQT